MIEGFQQEIRPWGHRLFSGAVRPGQAGPVGRTAADSRATGTIVIAGGGLSGLSLAGHLAAADYRSPVLVIDDGSHPVQARVWASWSDRPGVLDSAVSRRFDRVRIHAGGSGRVLGLGRYRYQVVRGTDLKSAVGHAAEGLANFAFVQGHVDRVESGRVFVDGEPLEGRWLFDSVCGPAEPPPVDAQLVFRGWQVHSERPVFDPDVPTLFDFRTPQSGAASFLYVLPADAHHALVEHTSFARAGLRPDEAGQREALAEYLTDVLRVGHYAIEGQESARLALRARGAPRRWGNVLRIGSQAGMVKASTGYAFQRVQRDSAAIVRSLRRRGHPFSLPGAPARYRIFDGALLEVVTREPTQLERAFTALFRHPTAEPALRFLDERTSFVQECGLFAAMPAAVYLAAVSRRLHGSRRRRR